MDISLDAILHDAVRQAIRRSRDERTKVNVWNNSRKVWVRTEREGRPTLDASINTTANCGLIETPGERAERTPDNAST